MCSALSAALAVSLAEADTTQQTIEQAIDYPEGAVVRITSVAPKDALWTLEGEDAERFLIEDGVLRFSEDSFRVARPDFEIPRDADGDNVYRVRVSRITDDADKKRSYDFVIRITDRDEPGRIKTSTVHPVNGETVQVHLTDPDDIEGEIRWRWQRSAEPDQWIPIDAANSSSYTPNAGDTGHFVRVIAQYHDRLGGPRTIKALFPETVIGPKLLSLDAKTDHGGKTLHPPFDPVITHYGIECGERDVLSVNFTLPKDIKASVNAIQPRPGRKTGAAAAVEETSDTKIVLSQGDGASTIYTIHCLPQQLAKIRTKPDPNNPLGILLGVTAGPFAAVIDENGVSRAHIKARGGNAGFFFRPFGSEHNMRWVHVETSAEEKQHWRVLDRNFNTVRTVATASPLTTTGRHDFRLLADGSSLLMTYEPQVRDFSYLSFPDPDGEPWGGAVETEDSAIQWLGPDGKVRWTWNSWDRIPLEDCSQHRFPEDWAHVNSIEWTDQGVLASFRGCSSVLMIDPEAPSGDEIVWRIGRTNLQADEWKARGLSPPPLAIVGDPEGEFCGQHAAMLLAPPAGLELSRLLLFDNGVACVTNPHTGEPLERQGERYSRVAEYAIDVANEEAIFVRDHALGNSRDRLGFAGGHVELLSDGKWLVSWGGGGANNTGENLGLEVTDLVTVVDPDKGQETFSIPVGDDDKATAGFRVLPVALDVLMRPQTQLHAFFPDPLPPSHDGAGKTFSILVSFSRPISEFGVDTPSIEISGGELTDVRPFTSFGRPANSYEIFIKPAANDPVCLSFRTKISCTEKESICSADGTELTEAPEPFLIPGSDLSNSQPQSYKCT